MSKWIEVPVTIIKTYAVEVEDKEGVKEAISAIKENTFGEFEVDESNCYIAETKQQSENIKIMADEKLPL